MTDTFLKDFLNNTLKEIMAVLRAECGSLFLFDPDHPTWRVDTCEYCQGYLKTITTFDPLEADMLPVFDLQTMLLDQIAGGEGYKRPFKQPLASG